MWVDRKLDPTIMRLVQRLVEEVMPEKVILFGSHVEGITTTDSDIDLLIAADMEGDFFQRQVKVREALSGLHRSIPLDPIVLTPGEVESSLASGNQFIIDIVENGTVLHAA